MRTRRWAAILLLLVGVLAAWAAKDLRVDNRIERWFDESGTDGETYARFRQDFGSDEIIFAVVGGGAFFTPEMLEALLVASEVLEATPGVVKVRGIATIYRDLFGAEDPEALADELTSTPFYRNLFLSSDGELTGILLTVSPGDDPSARSVLIRRTREALKPLVDSGRQVHLVGSTALIVALDEVSEAESRRTLPLALAGSLLVLVAMLRSFRATLVTSLCALVSVVLTLGVAAAAGLSLNMVTTTLAPLLWVLALSNSIHVLRRYQQLRCDHPQALALELTLAETTRPCTLAAVTTAVGFASLMVADLAPVRELGALTAIGLLLSLAVNLTLAPLLVEWLRVPPFRSLRTRQGTSWNLGWRAHPRWVLGVFAAVLLVSVFAFPFIHAQSDPVAFLPENHPTTLAYRSLNGGLGGFYTAELILQPSGIWYADDIWPTIDTLAERVAGSPIVSRVLSPVDIVRKLNQWNTDLDPAEYRVPATSEGVEAVILAAGDDAREDLSELLLPDGSGLRLSAMVNEIEENRFLELVDEIRALLAELPTGWSGEVTGQVLLLVNAQQALISTQLKSLCIALVLVFAVIALGLRSLRLTATALLPNLMPIVVAFALMALLRFPLDAATVMVASVALGIAVDNTVHVLENVRRRRAEGAEMVDAIAGTLEDIGPAMVATTATACAGFLALSRSEFVPIRDFGLLASAAMIVALVSDTLLLPAILMVRRR